ncbi:hypothetical protein [Photobacterium galatheae]|uniref:Uncharacterized protein n=1 Tax=Photobacterium galatheae TaxID=1654360 RepID=A0A066RKQ1_9GAMM|nr:hypothetical protein [Photobacterium galatheae]KDM91030.1 hypothetical protein EA58_14875 [Photobacterium galatheae]MCM0149018.1 hypothetical protein [Photobacterium galatheae]
MSKKNKILHESIDMFQSPISAHEVVIEARNVEKQENVKPIEIYDISFKKNNKEFSDGRIFGGYDSQGRYYAITVSPYFDEFETQIEKGIRGLVGALRGKGYLTCSSCYGHPKRAMVAICFPTKELRGEFSQILRDENIPTLEIQYKESMANVGVGVDKSGHVKFTKDLEFDHTFEPHRKMEVETFNQTFFRSYDEYHFLQVTLVDDYHPYLNPIKAWKTKKYLPMKDELIKRVTDLILSDKVPMFIY